MSHGTKNGVELSSEFRQSATQRTVSCEVVQEVHSTILQGRSEMPHHQLDS
jgi:hypothetical protein